VVNFTPGRFIFREPAPVPTGLAYRPGLFGEEEIFFTCLESNTGFSVGLPVAQSPYNLGVAKIKNIKNF
jgi:hypothetical protein